MNDTRMAQIVEAETHRYEQRMFQRLISRSSSLQMLNFSTEQAPVSAEQTLASYQLRRSLTESFSLKQVERFPALRHQPLFGHKDPLDYDSEEETYESSFCQHGRSLQSSRKFLPTQLMSFSTLQVQSQALIQAEDYIEIRKKLQAAVSCSSLTQSIDIGLTSSLQTLQTVIAVTRIFTQSVSSVILLSSRLQSLMHSNGNVGFRLWRSNFTFRGMLIFAGVCALSICIFGYARYLYPKRCIKLTSKTAQLTQSEVVVAVAVPTCYVLPVAFGGHVAITILIRFLRDFITLQPKTLSRLLRLIALRCLVVQLGTRLTTYAFYCYYKCVGEDYYSVQNFSTLTDSCEQLSSYEVSLTFHAWLKESLRRDLVFMTAECFLQFWLYTAEISMLQLYIPQLKSFSVTYADIVVPYITDSIIRCCLNYEISNMIVKRFVKENESYDSYFQLEQITHSSQLAENLDLFAGQRHGSGVVTDRYSERYTYSNDAQDSISELDDCEINDEASSECNSTEFPEDPLQALFEEAGIL